jgi:hypothetical protein
MKAQRTIQSFEKRHGYHDVILTMFSYPGGVSSAIIVWAKHRMVLGKGRKWHCTSYTKIQQQILKLINNHTYQNSQILWKLKKLVQNHNANCVIKTHPILVQIPSMPQNGIKIATIDVDMSWSLRSVKFDGWEKKIPCLTIFFVGILKYFWKYQYPSVLNADGTACASSRYVFCRKLKENLSFWHISPKVLVVLSPCNTFGRDREIIICTVVDSHRQARERTKGR